MADNISLEEAIGYPIIIAVMIGILITLADSGTVDWFYSAVIYLIAAIIYVGSIYIDIKNNLNSPQSFGLWIVSTAILVWIMGDWLTVVFTILGMIIAWCIKLYNN